MCVYNLHTYLILRNISRKISNKNYMTLRNNLFDFSIFVNIFAKIKIQVLNCNLYFLFYILLYRHVFKYIDI